MPKPFTDWTVLPHGSLTHVDDNILTVTGTLKMPLADFERRMTVVRLADGRLVIYSAIALDHAQMDVLESFGTVAFLIVPSDRHRLDVLPWKKRFPMIKVIAPEGARAKIEQLVSVDATTIDFHDPNVQFVIVGGTKNHEAALIVRGSKGTTLVVNEIIFNAADQPGFGGWMFHKLGMTGDAPHIPAIIKIKDIADGPALAAQLEAWSHLPNLERIIVSHGDVIENDAPEVLHQIARDMDSMSPTAGRETR
jgi:hypothetical protein